MTLLSRLRNGVKTNIRREFDMIWTEPVFRTSHLKTESGHRWEYCVQDCRDHARATVVHLDDLRKTVSRWYKDTKAAKAWIEDEYTKNKD